MRELLGDIIDAGFADVAKRIADTWPYPECKDYLSKLLIQDRIDRKGFPPKVITALMELQELRGVPTKISTVWEDVK